MLAVALTAIGAVERNDVAQARNLAERLSPRLLDKVEFVAIDAPEGKDVFTLEGRGGKVIIGGNNAGSMAVGLNRYLNRYCMTTVSWYADVPVELPRVLPDVKRQILVAEVSQTIEEVAVLSAEMDRHHVALILNTLGNECLGPGDIAN